MILLRLMGGLGNQMFQYAFASSLANTSKVSLKVDDTLLLDRSLPDEVVTHRDLVLNKIFDIDICLANKHDVEYFNGRKYTNFIGKLYNKCLWQFKIHKLIIEKSREFDADLLKIKDDVCLVGSFQSELYFKKYANEIRELYKFRNKLLPISFKLADLLESSTSVAVHVRRGDYVSSPLYSDVIGTLPMSYYDEAIEIMRHKVSSPTFFVFSDDINWCKKEFEKYQVPIVYIDDEHAGKYAGNYLQLMTLCKHFIISNSTFAWWGAWLSKHEHKMVIAPNKWFKKEGFNNNQIVPSNWTKI
jgi:hypothetical protein